MWDFVEKRKSVITVLLILLVIIIVKYYFAIQENEIYKRITGSAAKIECIIIDSPVYKGSYTKYLVKCKRICVNNIWIKNHDKMFMIIKNNSLEFGDKIVINGIIEDIKGKRNPGDFDFKLYYKSKGIVKNFQGQEIDTVEKDSINFASKILFNSKQRIKSIFYSALPESEAALLFGIITGDKTGMEEETINLYSKAGLAHILSVSGLHIGFLLLLINFLLSPIKEKEWIKATITIGVISFYVVLIGTPAPAVRAFFMLIVLIIGKIIKREYNLASSITFALLIMLFFNPLLIHDSGFIISFGCMYSIAFLYQPVNNRLLFLPKFLRDPLALSLAVWVGITPIIAYNFYYVTLIGIFLNIVAIPLSFAITLAGFIAAFIGAFLYYPSVYMLSTAYYLIKLMTFLSQVAVNLPFAGFYLPRLPFYFYIVYYIFVLNFTCWFGSVFFYNYKKRIMIFSVILLILSIILYSLPEKNMRMVILDVGQGDSIFIKTQNKKVILIDGGGSPAYLNTYDIGKNITAPALFKLGTWQIDTIIVSHIHEDHIKGLLYVVDTFHVNRVVLPKTDYKNESSIALLEKCKKKNISVLFLKKGSRIMIDEDTIFDVLLPDENLITGTTSDINNNSLVIKMKFKEFTMLFPGDIQLEAEEKLLKNRENINSYILKTAHHGSAYSSSPNFLRAVNPSYGIISVGKNVFGHPSIDTIERIKNSGAKVITTEENGAVIIVTDGKKAKVTTIIDD